MSVVIPHPDLEKQGLKFLFSEIMHPYTGLPTVITCNPRVAMA
jgi:hypothetical protein